MMNLEDLDLARDLLSAREAERNVKVERAVSVHQDEIEDGGIDVLERRGVSAMSDPSTTRAHHRSRSIEPSELLGADRLDPSQIGGAFVARRVDCTEHERSALISFESWGLTMQVEGLSAHVVGEELDWKERGLLEDAGRGGHKRGDDVDRLVKERGKLELL